MHVTATATYVRTYVRHMVRTCIRTHAREQSIGTYVGTYAHMWICIAMLPAVLITICASVSPRLCALASTRMLLWAGSDGKPLIIVAVV